MFTQAEYDLLRTIAQRAADAAEELDRPLTQAEQVVAASALVIAHGEYGLDLERLAALPSIDLAREVFALAIRYNPNTGELAMEDKLTRRDIYVLRMAYNNQGPDGWAPISRDVWPLMQRLPAELVQQVPGSRGTGKAKLTEGGKAIVRWISV